MRIRQPGMSPEKIAIAVAVTIAAMAGMGAMKNVTGTSSAVAIVAVNPGTAPTKRPNSDAASITKMLYGSSTRVKAWSQASLILASPTGFPAALPCDALQDSPRQRHFQKLVEGIVDAERHHDRERQDPSSAHAEHKEHRAEIDDTGQDESQTVDGEYVKHVDADRHRERKEVAAAARPRLEQDPLGALAALATRCQSLDGQEHRTESQSHCQETGKQRGPDLLSGNPGEALDMNEQRHAEQQQERTPDGVVEFHGFRIRMTSPN